ncbi:hypothetical protein GCM10009525_19970 [Streptosporangium amethystogenes subsp. fukuiense]
MEDQLGALGLVLNCVTLWNTFHMDRALDQLKAEGYPLAGEDIAHLSPFVRRHINVSGGDLERAEEAGGGASHGGAVTGGTDARLASGGRHPSHPYPAGLFFGLPGGVTPP